MNFEIDHILIWIYLLSILFIGITAKSPKTNIGYIYAGRKLTIPAFVATLVSTWYGGILEIGRFSNQNGISTWLVFGLFYYIAALIYARYIVDRISISNNGSIPTQFYNHYGKSSAIFAVILVFLLASPAPYLKMLATILSYIWKIDSTTALMIGVFFSTIYTLKGGFSSIVKTDFIQFLLMFLGFGYMAIYLYFNYGGIDFLSSQLSSEMLSFPGKLNWTYILTWGFIALITFVDPNFYQRVYSSSNIKNAKKGIYISVVFWFLFDIFSITVGIYSAAILPEIQFSPYIDLAEQILPPLIKGFFIISILSIIMSTIDSFIFISGFTIGKDLVEISSRKESNIMHVRLGIIISGLFSMVLAIFFTNAIDIWYFTGSLTVPCLLVPLFFIYGNIQLKNAFLCIVFPGAVTCIWFIYGYPSIDPMYPGLTTSLILCLLNKNTIS